HYVRCSPHALLSSGCCNPRHLPSFPTRRSSDLEDLRHVAVGEAVEHQQREAAVDLAESGDPRIDPLEPRIAHRRFGEQAARCFEDRKSTRLNSSHVKISYAVFCLQKKTRNRGTN